MKLSNIFRIGLVLMLVAVGVQSGLTYHYANVNVGLIRDAVERDFDASLHIARIAVEANKIRRYEKEFFIYVNSPSKRAEYTAEWEQAYRELKTLIQQGLEPGDPRWQESDRARFDTWDHALERYARGFRDVVRLVESGQITDTVRANSAIREAKNHFRVVLIGAADGGTTKFDHARANVDRIEQNNQTALISVGAAIAASLLLALLLAVLMPRSLARSVGILSEAAEQMSHGNIDVTIPVNRANAEFTALAQTLERMRVSQKVLMDRMRKRRA